MIEAVENKVFIQEDIKNRMEHLRTMQEEINNKILKYDINKKKEWYCEKKWMDLILDYKNNFENAPNYTKKMVIKNLVKRITALSRTEFLIEYNFIPVSAVYKIEADNNKNGKVKYQKEIQNNTEGK